MRSRNPLPARLPQPRPTFPVMRRRSLLAYTAALILPAAGGGASATSRSVTVTDVAQLVEALAEARPGDEIVLADGDYLGDRIVVASHGTARDPILIRSATLLGANLPGGLELSGSNIVVWGLRFEQPSARPNGMLWLGGTDNAVWNCRFVAKGGALMWLTTGSGGQVSFNEFTNSDPNDHYEEHVYIMRNWRNEQSQHERAEISYNYFHDFPSKPADLPYHRTRRGGLTCGSHYRYMFQEIGWHVHHNLLENCGSCRLAVYSSGNIIEYNTVVGKSIDGSTASTDFNQRLGWHNIWRGNWAEETKSGFSIHGGPNKFIGCRIVDGGSANVFAGNQEYDALGEGQPRAHDVKLTACEMPLIVGRQWSGHTLPARNTRIENHIGEVYLDDSGQVGTVLTAEMTEAPVTPVRITRDMVGPFARA